jgi:uncharacterized membrane protein (UPF0182 family)
MGPERPTEDTRFEGVGDWLVSHGQDALARGAGKRGPARWGARRIGRIVARVLIVGVLAWVVLGAISGPLANYLWFQNVGFGATWVTQFGYALALFLVGLVGGGVVLLLNLGLAWRLSLDPGDAVVAAQLSRRRTDARGAAWLAAAANLPRRAVRRSLVAAALALALVVGLLLAGAWQTLALWLHQVPYAAPGPAVADPSFGHDLGWWLFSLPLLHLAAASAGGLFLASLLLAGAAYGLGAVRGTRVTDRGPVLHLAVLGSLLLAAVAAMQWLGRYDLAYAQNGLVTGITATDAAVRLPLALVTTASTAVAAVGLLVLALVNRARLVRRVAIVGGAWYLALLVAGAVLPIAYQKLVVTPSQNLAEAPYIANNIDLTRRGFALDTWTLAAASGKSSLTAADVSNDQATFDNARLWDASPLSATLDQLQTVRQYYTFTSVNIDRYVINGQQTEVMLSAREMALANSQANPSWIASHVLYTHGYGLAMVPVNAVDPNGLPHLIIQNLPVTQSPGAPVVTQPRIYFGQRPSTWVLVDAKSNEFDYPSSTGNGSDVDTRFTGGVGLPLDSPAARLFWAWNLGDLNLAISDQVTAQTKLLLHQSLADRLGTLAPFLALDGNPYLVVAPDGRLVYVQDAYTLTGGMPDATTVNDATLGATYNYIRNSVKITVDAYDGTTHFYVADAADPLIRAWEGVFPTMFEPLSAMPADLAAHLRTPEAMFNAQTQIFAAYHVTDPASFYKSDNLWTVPTVTTGGTQVLPPQAYYIEMRLPDQSQPEFVLVQPMVPASRPNMIAWVAARNDGAARGQVVTYELPANTTIQGPTQIEARIDQDPVISAQISLWNQSGSQVIRGRMLVIPVGTSFLYLEPIYLQSKSSAFPQLTKVVVASSQTVGWGATLKEALAAVVSGAGTGGQPAATGTGTGTGPAASPSPGPPVGLPTDMAGLIRYANDHFAAARADQASGNLAAYDQELQLVQSALDALSSLNGGLSASPLPSASPVPVPSASATPAP